MSHEEYQKSPVRGQLGIIDLPDTVKILERCISATSLEALSDLCKSCILALHKNPKSTSFPKHLLSKLTSFLENLSPEADLSLFYPIIEVFSHIYHTHPVPLSQLLVNSLCSFIVTSKIPSQNAFFVPFSVKTLDFLYFLAMQKKKKLENYDPAWAGKVFNAFCGFFENLTRNPENEYWGRTGFCIENSLILAEESRNFKGIRKYDIVLYTAIAISQLGKIINAGGEQIIILLPGFMAKLQKKIREIQDFNDEKTRLEMEKIVAVFGILNTIAAMLGKVENFRIVLKNAWERAKDLFYWGVIGYCKSSEKSFIASFDNHPHTISRLYSELSDLSQFALNSEMEPFPLQLFQHFSHPDLCDLIQQNYTIQIFTLEFLYNYLHQGLKKCKIPDLGLIELLFSPVFFRSRNQELWSFLFSYLQKLPDYTHCFAANIVKSIKSSSKDAEYFSGLFQWFSSIIQDSQSLVLELMKNRFLEAVLVGVENLAQNAKNPIGKLSQEQSSELYIEFFIMLKSLLYIYEIPENLDYQITEFLLQEKLINTPTTADLALSCLATLLRPCGPLPYKKMLQVLKTTSDFWVLKKLLETIQEILKETDKKKHCQETLVVVGIFGLLKDLIFIHTEKSSAKILWPLALECIRFVIHDNKNCKKHLVEFDFYAVAILLLSENFQESKCGISENCTEIGFYILFETTNLQIFHEVVNPEIVPLICAFSCSYLSPFNEYLICCLDYPYNAVMFAGHGCMKVLAREMAENLPLGVFEFLIGLMEKTLAFDVQSIDLKAIIKNSEALPGLKQQRFFSSLVKGLQKAFVNNEDLAEGLSQMLLNPTCYYWFHKPSSHIKFSSESTTFLPKKDFCIITWVFPLTKNRACLADFSDKKSHFLITTLGQSLEISYINDKKISFKISTGPALIENKWNLVCISCQQITKFLTTQSSYEINVNNHNCELKIEGKICSFSSNFNMLTLGNSYDYKLCYNGKIAVFYVANKVFNDFSHIYSANEQLHLPFIHEALTVFSHFDNENYRELMNHQFFKVNSLVQFSQGEEVGVDDDAEKVNGVDAISSFINIGGLEVLLVLFKSSSFSVSLQLLEIISCLCQSRSISLLISEDFFETLSNILESISTPTEDLLESTKKLIGRLDWNPHLQRQSFRHLMINSKIWNTLTPSILENYLGTLSLYIPNHLTCILEDCFPLYTHLSNLSPLPLNFFAENLGKLLPRIIELKNFEALSFLLFRMSQDNTDLLENFLKEMSSKKFSKDSIKEITYLLLHFLDWPHNYSILTGLLQVFKTVIDILVREYASDKNSWADDEIFTFILGAFDRRIGQEINLEVLQGIKNITELSYNFTNKKLSEKFGMFIDLITSRMVFLQTDCVEAFVQATNDYRFCIMVTERPSFPDWLVGCYFSEVPEAHELGITLFSFALQTSYLHKLRMFLINVSKQNADKALDFYYKVLEKLIKRNAFKGRNHYFLDYAAILEDLLNPDLTGRMMFDGPLFVCIVVALVQCSKFLEMVHCTYPPLPKMDFSLQLELLKETPMKSVSQQDFIYLREGGFFRLILKYIFLGLHYFQSSPLIRALKIVLKGGEDNGPYSLFTKKTPEKFFSDFESERFSIAYPHFPVRNGDLIYTEEFICLYTLAEITDLLSTNADQGILDFILDFLQHFDLPSLLILWSKKISNKELEDCFKMLKDCRLQCYVTSRSRLHYMERNPYLDIMKTLNPVPLNVFVNNVQDQAQLLSDAKSNEHLLRELLSSHNWIGRVQVFIVAFTSMKLNFIANMVKLPSLHLRKSSAPEFFSQAMSIPEEFSRSQLNFVQGKQEEVKNWQANFISMQGVAEAVRGKKVNELVKFYKKIDGAFKPGKLKMRWRSDALGRMSTCTYDKLKLRSTTKKKTLISPLEPKLKGKLHPQPELSLCETFTDDTDILNIIGETEEELIEENIPELKQSIQVECERIKVSYSLFGYLEISNNTLLFISEGKEKPSGNQYFGSSLKFMQECKKSCISCKVDHIHEVFPRRYIHKHSAFEVFMKSGKSYFFNVFTTENRDKVLEAMKSWKHVKLITDLTGVLLRNYTKRWKKCEISNLEYLMLVNKFASRSFNDLSQYPIFPWVLKDYTSDDLKLDDPCSYRNLKLPIGAQGDLARQEADLRFSMGIDDHPYHFGSHYSNGAVVLHYLVRLEPFASLAKSLQGGSFDIADRLFHSLKASWDSGQGSTGDVKELVPELFYLPEVLRNSNCEELGVRQDGEIVDDVSLPNWATGPVDFIRKHAQALESTYVSQNLHCWIDLIFGCRQKGKMAKNSYNLFLPMSYEDNFRKILESNEGESFLQGMVEQVVHFGQTPVKIFKSPHPARDPKSSETSIFDKYRKYSESNCTGCQTSGEICSLLLTSKYLILVKHLKSRVSILRISLNDLDEYHIMFERKKEKFLLHSKPGNEPLYLHYCMLGENKIISGNHMDGSFKIHTIGGHLLHSVFGHTGVVSCVASFNNYVFTGSKDSSLVSWQYSIGKVLFTRRFLGHTSSLVQISSIAAHYLLCSLNSNGDILIHDFRTGECLQGIKSSFTGICTSPIKLIAGYNSRETQIMDLQGRTVWKKTGHMKMVRFDTTGENLCFSKDFSWGFWNLFDEHKKFEKKEERAVMEIQIATGQNYLVHTEKDGKYSFVYSFQIVNKDRLVVNQRINF